MPYIHIQISGTADDTLAQGVAKTASDITARVLKKDPALTAVVIDFVPASQWFVAGQRLADSRKRSYHWTVSITDETNTKGEKAAYLAAVHQAMDELLHGAVEHSYTYVVDARAAAYGFGGQSQEWRYQHTA
jgi:4-oxalocrotonate tautomerase